MDIAWTKYRKSMEKEWKKREGIFLTYMLIINVLRLKIVEKAISNGAHFSAGRPLATKIPAAMPGAKAPLQIDIKNRVLSR